MSDEPQYDLRARFCGTLDWLCPFCGYVNRSRIDRTGWQVQCKAKPCRRRFAYGLILHSLAALRGSGRAYVPPPDVTFPVAELDFWQSGGPVNRHVFEPGDDTARGNRQG